MIPCFATVILVIIGAGVFWFLNQPYTHYRAITAEDRTAESEEAAREEIKEIKIGRLKRIGGGYLLIVVLTYAVIALIEPGKKVYAALAGTETPTPTRTMTPTITPTRTPFATPTFYASPTPTGLYTPTLPFAYQPPTTSNAQQTPIIIVVQQTVIVYVKRTEIVIWTQVVTATVTATATATATFTPTLTETPSPTSTLIETTPTP